MTSRNRNFITQIGCLLLLGLSFCARSQSRVNWATDSDFLPQNSIKSIVPDKYGFIWMSTENGLVRYDGKDFEIYNNLNIGIKNNRLLYIIGSSRKDSLYINTDAEDDYILINRRAAKKIDPAKYPKSRQYVRGTDIPFIANGIPSVLFGTPKKPYKIPLPSDSYFIIANDSVRLYNPKGKMLSSQPFEYESNNRFFSFDDSLFYLKDNGDYAHISKTGIVWHHLDIALGADSKLIWNVIPQQVFLYSKNNVYSISGNDGKLQKSLLIADENLIADNVGSLYHDVKNGIIYLGGITKGLGIYKILPFKSLHAQEKEPGKYEIYYALHGISNNEVMTSNGVIFDNQNAVKKLNFSTDGYAMVIDKNQDAWIKSGENIFRYKKSSGYLKAEKWAIDNVISTLYEGIDGKIWFSTEDLKFISKGLYYFIPEEKPVFHKFSDNNLMVTCLQQSQNDILWLGTRTGLHQLDLKTGKYSQISGSGSLKVRNVFITDKNDVWVTTYEKGFFLFRDGKKYSFPTDKNKYLLTVHCIVEDNKGFFWISTNKGLFQVRKKSLLDYADKKTNAVYYHYYNKDYGFTTNEFNGGCQPCGVLAGENMFFPSINGVVTFNPNTIEPILPDNAIFIDKAEIGGKDFLIADTLRLNRDFGRVTFFCTSPYYGNTSNQNLEARLDGPDALDWTEISPDNKISFTNLYPGNYELTIRKLSGFGNKYIYKKINIRIAPAFWQTMLFRIFIFVLIAFFAISLYKLRTKFMRHRNSLLEHSINEKTSDLHNTIRTLRETKDHLNQQIENNTKIIQIITHDIKSPLKFMSMASKYMYDSFEEDTEDLKDNIHAIYSSSSQMYNFVENLLEYSKVNLEDDELLVNPFVLHDVIAEKIALFDGIAHSKKTVIRNLIPDDVMLKKNKQLFRIILHNLLDNAVKHTTNGTITFTLEKDESDTIIKIADTGKGINAFLLHYYQSLSENYDLKRSTNKERVGLHIVLELLLILNGKMHIDSKENQGTTVMLIFS